MNYIKYHDLKPGDRIITPKSAIGLIQHHVIYLGQSFEGQDLIAENAFGRFVRVVTAEEFFSEYPQVPKIIHFQGSNLDRKIAVRQALDQLGRPYNLINFNCEHFANLVQTGNAKSFQLQFAAVLVLILATVMIFND